MSTEKICTLSVDHAIRISKIIATAPVEWMPMITQLFHQASVDLEGLDELIATSSLGKQGNLIDTISFLEELTAGRERTKHGYLLTLEEFNQFCYAKGLLPRLVRRHLYAGDYLEAQKESSGKINYSINIFVDGKTQRRVAIKDFRSSKKDMEVEPSDQSINRI